MVLQKKSLWMGVLAGVVYGLLIRGLGQVPAFRTSFAEMSLAFLFFTPLAIGVISVSDKDSTYRQSFLAPMLAVLLGCLATAALAWEGWICIVMYLPGGLILSGLGGLLKLYFLRRKKQNIVNALLILPLLAPVESRLQVPVTYQEVNSEILIPTTSANVWREIKSVRTISKAELPGSWVHRMGFPRPLDAEIDKEGVGGIRKARFEGDLVFTETVTTWRPNEELTFTIEVDPNSVPPTTLDEHVTIGGPFFDVLEGSYRIEEAGPGMVLLKLKSKMRVSTHFNFYASWWAKAVMGRIQDDILSVIQQRARI